MGLLHYLWSRTAASNATADAQINWAEGQAPSSVNDSARAMMASLAGYRDDISGAIVTTGTSTAYAVTSYQIFDSLAHMDKMVIAFTPHATNGATVTLNVDTLGAKPLRSAPSAELPAGTLIQGTPYVALYNNSDAAWYLQGFFGNPYNVPVGASIEFWGSTAPNSSFVIPAGQAISRTTYSVLFGIISTTYGAGDGSTTFNLPNPAGRVVVQKESSATLLTSSYFGGNSTTLGATGGSESNTLTTAQLPAHNHAVSDPGHSHGVTQNAITGSTTTGGGGFPAGSNGGASISVNSATTGISTTNTGSGNAHNNVQPTLIANRIMRII